MLIGYEQLKSSSSPFEYAGFIECYDPCIQSVAAPGATFVNDAFDFFLGLAGAFLDASDQLVLLAVHELQIVVRQLRKFLFQLAFGDVPVAFHFQCVHK